MNVSDFCITTHIVQYHATTFVMISFVCLLQKFLCIVLHSTHHGFQLGPFASLINMFSSVPRFLWLLSSYQHLFT